MDQSNGVKGRSQKDVIDKRKSAKESQKRATGTNEENRKIKNYHLCGDSGEQDPFESEEVGGEEHRSGFVDNPYTLGNKDNRQCDIEVSVYENASFSDFWILINGGEKVPAPLRGIGGWVCDKALLVFLK